MKGATILTGEQYDLFMSVLKMMIEWEKDYRSIPENSNNVINRLNSYLIHHTKIEPSKNLRDFIMQLKTLSIDDFGFETDDEIKGLKILDDQGRLDLTLKYWHEKNIYNDDTDQNLIREFLLACRDEYNKTQDQRILKMYSEVRAFINASNYCLTTDRIMSLIGKYSNVSENIMKVRDWYENIKLTSKINYVCPVCGKLLSNDVLDEFRCTDMCMYYRDKDSLELKEFTINEEFKYKKLKHGIYTFTLIPGISELRIFKYLSELYGEDKVILYPEIDKFDLYVVSEQGNIYIDVKDFASPHDLVELLIRNQAFIKMESVSEEDYIYLVIPEHRKFIYKGGNYKNIVKKKISQITQKVQVVYENDLYKEVGEIINGL